VLTRLFLSALCALLALPAFADSITGTVQAPVPKFRNNVIVFVKQGPPAPAAKKTVLMDQKGLVFLPRVLPIQNGWTVEFLNSDPVAHNVFTVDGDKYDLGTWPQGQKKTHTFTKTGTYRQLCRVHDDMIAFIVVLDTPWFAVSDKAGNFKLDGLPPGQYTLGVWHEKLKGADVQVTVAAGQPAKADVVVK
jgi:plastocyanin